MVKIKHNILILLFLLSACGEQPKPQLDPSFNRDAWHMRGKMLLSYPECAADCKQKNWQLALDWTHRDPDDALTIYDPLGRELARLHSRDGAVKISHHQEAMDLNTFDLQQLFGFSLADLANWMTAPEALPPAPWQWQASAWKGRYYQNIVLKQNDKMIKLFIQNLEPLEK